MRLCALWLLALLQSGTALATGDPPLSPEARELRRLLLDPRRAYTQGALGFLSGGYSEDSAPGLRQRKVEAAFLELLQAYPELETRIEEGLAFRTQYAEQLRQRLEVNREQYGISDAPAQETYRSFRTFLLSLNEGGTRRRPTHEAERMAEAEVRAKYPNTTDVSLNQWKFEHPDAYRQYTKRLRQLEEEEIPKQDSSQSNEALFQQWKERERKQLEAAAFENVKRAVRCLLENTKVTARIEYFEGPNGGERLLKKAKLKVEDLDRPGVRFSFISNGDRSLAVYIHTPQGKGLVKLINTPGNQNDVYLAQNTLGELFGKGWFDAQARAGLRVFFPRRTDETEDAARATVERVSESNRAILRLLNLLEGTAAKNTKTLEEALKTDATVLKVAQASFNVDHFPRAEPSEVGEKIAGLGWWGLKQDRNYWIERDTIARPWFSRNWTWAFDRTERRASWIANTFIGLFLGVVIGTPTASIYLENHKGKGKGPDGNAPVASRWFGNEFAPSESVHSPFNKDTRADKMEIFRVLPGRKTFHPRYVEIPYVNDYSEEGARNATGQVIPEASDIYLDTRVKQHVRDGILPLAGIPNQKISSLELRAAGSTTLSMLGNDYQVFQSQSGSYFVKFNNPDTAPSTVTYRAGYIESKVPPVHLPSILTEMDTDRLESIVKEIREAGFVPFANAIASDIAIARKEGNPISIQQVASHFANNALYSYLPAKWRKPNLANNRYSAYRDFLNEEGNLCAQCDGTNQFFSEFLEHYLEGTKGARVEVRHGFLGSSQSLRLSDLHQWLVIQVDGQTQAIPLLLDVTPGNPDPRQPTPPSHEPFPLYAYFRRDDLVIVEEDEKGERTIRLGGERDEQNEPRRDTKPERDRLRELREKLLNNPLLARVRARGPNDRLPSQLALQTSQAVLDYSEGHGDIKILSDRLRELFPVDATPVTTPAELDQVLGKLAANIEQQLGSAQDRALRGEKLKQPLFANPLLAADIRAIFNDLKDTAWEPASADIPDTCERVLKKASVSTYR